MLFKNFAINYCILKNYLKMGKYFIIMAAYFIIKAIKVSNFFYLILLHHKVNSILVLIK